MSSTQSAKALGRRFQKEVIEILREYWPHLDDGDLDWQSMGSGGEDIILSPRAEKEIPFSIECKVGKQPPWKPGFEQAKKNAGEDRIPLYVRREKYSKERLCVLRLEDLLSLKQRWSSKSDDKLSQIKQILC
jgi:hypothetical protein